MSFENKQIGNKKGVLSYGHAINNFSMGGCVLAYIQQKTIAFEAFLNDNGSYTVIYSPKISHELLIPSFS